jgi:hypothetical protein
VGYYMRFFDTQKKRLSLKQIRTALRRIDREYELAFTAREPQHGILRYAGVVYAEIDLSEPGDRVFEGEIAEMLEALPVVKSKTKVRAKELVEETLRAARRTVVVCVRFGTKEVEETLSRIDPIWDFLFSNRTGMLHAQGEGFYDEDDLILAVK